MGFWFSNLENPHRTTSMLMGGRPFTEHRKPLKGLILNKTDYSSPSSHKLSTASQLEMLVFCWTTELFCSSCPCFHSHCEFICVTVLCLDTTHYSNPIPLDLRTFLHHLLWWPLRHWRKICYISVFIGLRTSQSLIFCTFTSCGSLWLLIYMAQRSFCDEVWETHF